MARKRKKDQDEGVTGGHAGRITPMDIQQKEFRMALRGYSMGEVDVFLDQLTEEVARLHAENKRLSEEAELRSTARSDLGAQVEAEAILRRARDEASRIVAEAEVRVNESLPSTQPTGPPLSQMSGLLSREKEFLQRMAALIQQHAQDVKETAARARQAPSRPPARGNIGDDEAHPSSGPRIPPEGAGGMHSAGEASLIPEARPASSTTTETSQPSDEPVPDKLVDLRRENEMVVLRDGMQPSAGPPPSAPPRPPVVASESVLGGEPQEEDPGEDRSLRELFWGQD
jgi:DivIVA domain-containing protein